MDILQQLKYEDGITIGEALNVSVTGFVVVLLILALLAVLVLLLSKAVRAVESKTHLQKRLPHRRAHLCRRLALPGSWTYTM